MFSFFAPKALFLDFDGVLTDNYVLVDSLGNESVRCSKYDSFGLSQLKLSATYIAVISSEINSSLLTHRCKKLGIDCFASVKNKLEAANQICSHKKFKLQECAFIGNDLNDLELLSNVGMPICVKDSHPKLLENSFYITSSVGGHGAVREITDKILEILDSNA